MLIPLKMAILLHGGRQYRLAAATKIEPARLSRIINGILPPSATERQAIAQYLNKKEKDLFGLQLEAADTREEGLEDGERQGVGGN